MSARLDDLVPELAPFARDLVTAAGAAGLQPRVTSTRRSHTEQARLFRRYLAGQAEVPVAPPGSSAHEQGWAFDMVVTPFEALSDVAAAWIDAGGAWGGQADPVHFELPGASAEAKRLAITPGTPENHYLAQTIDFALGFLPVSGVASTIAGLLELFPSLSQSELLNAISNPLTSLSKIGAQRILYALHIT